MNNLIHLDSFQQFRSMLINLLVICIIFYSVLLLLVYLFQSYLVYFPVKQLVYTPKTALQLDYEEIIINTQDKIKIHGWFIPAKEAKGTILFCHGNAGNISHRLESIHIFNRLHLNTLIFDYQGYGQSEGKPSEKGTYKDAEAAWNYLCRVKNIKPENIIIFGRSLGASIATWLAKDKSPAAVILESSFTSIPDIGTKVYPFLPIRLVARFEYNTSSYVQKIKCNKLFIHSKNDEIIPFSMGEKNYELASEPKQFLTIYGSHNEGFIQSIDIYSERLLKFVNEVLSP